MDSEDSSQLTGLVKCCDCECGCSFMNQYLPGILPRSVKRKYDEFENGDKSVTPGLAVCSVARVEMENECSALREMVGRQQKTIQDLSDELDEERNAASSAANEAMSMILRLQSEKAEIQMEARQFKRFVEEKMAHDQQELQVLEDLLYKREQTIQSLTCEVQTYKYRMMSYGLTEAEAEGAEMKDFQSELPLYAYPPLKVIANNMNYPSHESEAAAVERYAFHENSHSEEDLRELQYRINELGKTPKSNQHDGEYFVAKNVIEKVVVGQSTEMPSHSKNISANSSSTVFTAANETGLEILTDSPTKLCGTTKNMDYLQEEEYPNLKKVDGASDVSDDTNDRVYTIDSVHERGPINDFGITDAKASVGVSDNYLTTTGGFLNCGDSQDLDIKKLYIKIQELEADRESMRQALISMRTDKAQLILLKEIAQHLCKDRSPARRMPVRKLSPAGSFSLLSIFKWIISFVFWRRNVRPSKYSFGRSADKKGMLMLLDKGPRIEQWRCLPRIPP